MSPVDRRLRARLVVALFALLAVGAFFDLPGKSVAGAWRVLAGERPYRDFWTMYAPGEFYATALMLWVSGRQILAPALVACLLKALTSGVLFTLGREVGAGARVAASIAFVLGAAQFELAPELSSYPPALFAISLAWLQVARFAVDARSARLLRAGLAFGVAAFFKHDVAGYAALGSSLGLVLASWTDSSKARAAAFVDSVRVLASAAAVVAAIALGLAWWSGIDAWRDLVVFPLGDFQIVRSEPYPGLLPSARLWNSLTSAPGSLARTRDVAEALAEWGLANAPQYAFVLAGVFAWRSPARRTRSQRVVAGVAWASTPLFWFAAHTQQNTHFTSMAVLSGLVGVALWNDLSASKLWRRIAFAIGGFYLAALAIRPAMEAALPLVVWSQPVALDLPAARGVFVAPREKDVYTAIADYVNANVPEGEPIHLGVARHDAIVINNPRFGYLLDRPIATRYHELHPGVTDRDDVQREMIADLERKHVSCAVIWRFGWPESLLESIVARRTARIPQCGSRLLDEYFAERFEPVLEVGEYAVLRRR